MNVLSLFDGMSCGRIALERAEIPVTNYYASEIDKYAITVSNANYPGIIRLGDVTDWQNWDIDWASIDLILAGSPCQGFSFAGKQLAFDDPRSRLFFTFVDIVNKVEDAKDDEVNILLENVKMKKEFLAVINDCLDIEPVFINSNLVSAQNRQRYYWANWDFKAPLDKDINLNDILEPDTDPKFDISDRQLNRLDLNAVSDGGFRACFKRSGENVSKSECLQARDYKGISGRQHFTLAAYNVNDNPRVAGVNELSDGYMPYKNDGRKGSLSEIGRISKSTAKATTVTTSHAPKLALNGDLANLRYRKLTPVECERLQTVPDNYTAHVSNTQRYKMLGNGWTVDVIAHILRGLKNA